MALRHQPRLSFTPRLIVDYLSSKVPAETLLAHTLSMNIQYFYQGIGNAS